MAAGATCTKDTECVVAHDCVKIKDAENFICTAFGSLKDGATFTEPAVTSKSVRGFFKDVKVEGPPGVVTLGGSNVCETNSQGTVGDVIQCRSAQRNVDQKLTSQNVGNQCTTNTFVTDGVDDFATKTEVKTTPLCGFNKDNKAICPIFAGDDYIMELAKGIREAQDKQDCHRSSGQSNFAGGAVCEDFFKIKDTKEAFLGFRAGEILGSPQVWANTANNDQCVAQGITFRNWNGHDSAYLSYGVVGMVATAFASIMM